MNEFTKLLVKLCLKKKTQEQNIKKTLKIVFVFIEKDYQKT